MVPFSFGGHALYALAQGAVFWPARRAMLVADLHLEKASWFAKGGQMLPPYDSLATLADLTAVAAATDAAEIWCLGDSFHDRAGCDRLPAEARALLTALTGKTRWTWITGNHDPVVPALVGGQAVAEVELEGVILRHEAQPADPRPEVFRSATCRSGKGWTITAVGHKASSTRRHVGRSSIGKSI